MMSGWRWKVLGGLLFVGLSAWFALPNVLDLPQLSEEQAKKRPWYEKMIPNSQLRLGLDLQGGIHMVLGIDLRRALLNEADRHARDLKEFLPDEKIPIEAVDREFDSTKITVVLENKSDFEAFENFIRDRFNILTILEREPSTKQFLLDIESNRKRETEQETIRQALETLRNRLDEFGVVEPSIQAKGNDRIIIQLPGMADPERAKSVLGRTAQLEFKIVEESMNKLQLEKLVMDAKKKLKPGFRIEDLNRALRGKIPKGTQVLFQEEQDPSSNLVVQTPYLLNATTLLTGEMLDDARISIGQYNQPEVALSFNPSGAKIFDKVTAENLKRQLAIILDDKVHSAPVLQAHITDGRAVITFGSLQSRSGLMKEAKDLALVLRAGALPAPVEVLQNRSVGPSLGRDSIQNGLKAILIGVFAIVIFMAFYYRLAGVVADIAVLINLVFILACLGALHATLTLPGIAGILISIGMAVDANVIIYERIREELREGKAVKAAIEAAYERAHLTILDANLTTIITAVVLLNYGTGPVRGFAITLIFGLIANYITALWLSRLVFDWAIFRFQPKRFSV